MKRKILAFALAMLLVLSINVSAFADESVSGAKKGVAVLATFFKGDTTLIYDGNGSCFFIGVPGEDPQFILTNHHVIEDYLQYGAGKTGTFSMDGETVSGKMILRVYYDWNDFEEAYFVEADEAQDIALLRLAKPTNKRVALPIVGAVENSMVGDAVHAIGYPAYADIVDSTSTWSADDSLVTNGSVSRLVTESGTGAQWIEIAATEWGAGNSGGPVITNNGSVVGMVSHSQSLDATIWKAVNIVSVFSMLDKNSVNYRTTAEGSANKGTSESQSLAEDTVDTTSVETEKTDVKIGKGEPEFRFEPWMIIAAVLAVLLIILVAVLFTRRKALGGNAVVSKQTVPYVRSLSAQHGGMRVQVGTQPVVIGRQNDCAIRFQSGTPGVSGVHCQIAWDGNSKEFILTDLKSSYGTFLETGQRLAPHAPIRLRSGDSFYVGDKANILRVEILEA